MGATDLTAELRRVLRGEPLGAPAACLQLGISQSAFSLLWKKAGPEVISFGAGKSTLYGLTREIADLGSAFPLFRVDAEGNATPFGELRTLRDQWNVFIPEGGTPEVSEGLPFFLQDLRPQGFLGRHVPALNAELKLPAKILEWSDDDVLRFLARRGEHAPGDVVVGTESYLRLTTKQATGLATLPAFDRQAHYPAAAALANKGEIPGSSAGGEQPKFTALVERDDGRLEHVIVKFSASITTENGRRWADLLCCEFLALQTLREHGHPASQAELLTIQDRVYLEVVRFDRLGQHGRAPVVSMAGMDCLLGALDKNWTASTMILRDKRQLPVADWETVRLFEVFGALIGNTDRHPGNLSLYWSDDGNFKLAPAFDMLPMMYQPNRQGEVVEREFNIDVLHRLDVRALAPALDMALGFWRRVTEDSRISEGFRGLARRHADSLRAAFGK